MGTPSAANPPTTDLGQARQQALPLVRYYVLRHGGTEPDVEDLLQEGLLVLARRLREPDFTLTVPVRAYLFAVCRNLWRKHLRDRRPARFTALENLPEPAQEPLHAAEEQERQISTWLGRITLRCQRLLTDLYLLARTAEQVKQAFGYRNAHTLASQKHKCLQSLRREAGPAL